ncbi:MAG: ferrochelatase [Bacteroidales bacterium]|nr:ferrochelatase [Bacteroidales bacterium]
MGDEYKEEFLEKGGEKLQLVESLNAEPAWIETMANLIRDKKD